MLIWLRVWLKFHPVKVSTSDPQKACRPFFCSSGSSEAAGCPDLQICSSKFSTQSEWSTPAEHRSLNLNGIEKIHANCDFKETHGSYRGCNLAEEVTSTGEGAGRRGQSQWDAKSNRKWQPNLKLLRELWPRRSSSSWKLPLSSLSPSHFQYPSGTTG